MTVLLLILTGIVGFICRGLRREQETSWVITYLDKEGKVTHEDFVCGYLNKEDVHEWVINQTAQPFWTFKIKRLFDD